MVMKTKDGREVRESERNLESLGDYSEKRASKSKIILMTLLFRKFLCIFAIVRTVGPTVLPYDEPRRASGYSAAKGWPKGEMIPMH